MGMSMGMGMMSMGMSTLAFYLYLYLYSQSYTQCFFFFFIFFLLLFFPLKSRDRGVSVSHTTVNDTILLQPSLTMNVLISSILNVVTNTNKQYTPRQHFPTHQEIWGGWGGGCWSRQTLMTSFRDLKLKSQKKTPAGSVGYLLTFLSE